MKERVLALVDCNNFYVSCERAFHAAIQHTPVIVLSNNDGCVVARSNEAKKLGIKMGQPVFECERLIREHKVQVFSSNYSLYADISARVMSVLSQFTSRLETYSIDEAFLDLSDLPLEDCVEFGREIKARVWQYTGIPVSVGIAATKTLCKIACEVVKQEPQYGGVLDLSGFSEAEIDTLLAKVELRDVWGIGPKYTRFLENYGFRTAKDLKYADERWIRKYLTVVGERTVLELRGICCLPLEIAHPTKKGIMCAKSFGRDITSPDELQEAVATYTARAAEKLREQDTLASQITVFVHTNAFHKDEPQYSNSFTIRLRHPTSFTPTLIRYALTALRAIYRKGYRYKKAGVLLNHISASDFVQPDLFGEFSIPEHTQQARLMAIVDAINQIYGRNTLFFAAQGLSRPWKMQQHRLSARFTTRWDEILTIENG